MMMITMENEMFDMIKFIQKLESFHTQYNISIESIAVMDNGWLITFTCLGKVNTGMEGRKYQRVAFFEANSGPEPCIKWDSIC